MTKLFPVFLCLFLAVPSAGKIIVVDDTGPADFNNIQAAINDSNDGDIIVVFPGIYTGEGNRDIDFLGKAVTVRSVDPEDAYFVASTVIDCNGTEGDMHRGFYFHSGEDANSVLDGLTIKNGHHINGGGINCSDSDPSIRNCVISDNCADYFQDGCGGGIYLYYSNAEITDCIVNDNDGDGIYCYRSAAVLTGCEISDNNSLYVGRGICCDNSSAATINDCVIQNNKEDGIGCFSGSHAGISECTISGNGGRGIYVEGSNPFIEKCKIRSNTHSGLECKYGNPTISSCRISSNFASEGGGIYCDDAQPTISNCIITDNFAAESGGGIYCWGSEPRVVNCIIANNEALDYGGGVCSYGDSNPRITNCILWDNLADGGSQIALWSDAGLEAPTVLSVSYSDVEGGQGGAYVDIGCTLNWGVGMIESEPGFAFSSDFHLTGDSPCVDAGTNSPTGGLPGTDLDGNLRPLDGDGDGNSIADMGVYEFNPQQPSIAVSAESVEFFMQEGGAEPNGQILSIRNAGGGTLAWEIVEDCGWVETIPAAGTSAGEVNDVVLEVNSAGLTHGDYNCQLNVEDQQAVNNPRTVAVTLHINKTLAVPFEFGTIQAAIDAAVDGDVVLIADGTYTGEGNKNLDFMGKAITVRSQNGLDNCVIDCEGQGRGFYLHSLETPSAVIEGLTIINGCTSRIGNGICCLRYSSPTIKNCIIEGCTSTAEYAWGSGIFCGGRTTIEDCTVKGNKGGIGAFHDTTISRCLITENYNGPGIVCIKGRHTVEYCTISHNQGGGIAVHTSDTLIKDSVITGNVVTEEHSQFAIGAGVNCAMRSCPTITNTIISGNFTEYGGGGIFCNMDSHPGIKNCTITGNKATLYGGGIWATGFNYPTVSNSILWGNTAEVGNQIALEFEDASAESGITINYSDVEGGENDVFVGPNSVLNWELGNIDVDPCFVKPGYWDPNGTPDDVNDDFWVDGDYHLKSEGWLWDTTFTPPRWGYEYVTSRCIDAGNPGSPLGEELLSVPDDPTNTWGENLRINMGAYGGTAEASMPPYHWTLLADLTNDGIVDFLDLRGWTNNWINSAGEQPGDLDRNGIVDIFDFALFAQDWSLETSWHE